MARIIILGSAYPLRGGGLATFNERLARAFAEQGHQVSIYTFSLQYPGILFPGKTQYSDEAAPGDLDIHVKVNSINPLNWLKVGRELRSLKPDVLVIRYWLPFMAPSLGSIASIVRKNGHTRVVAIADNIIPHEKRPGDKWLTRYFTKRVDGFVTMSRAVMHDLKSFAVQDQQIRFCQHPLYDNFGKPVPGHEARNLLGLKPDDKLVLFFGFIREYKGLDLLIKAMASDELREMGVKLLVAGEFYSSSEKYTSLVKELNISENVIWRTEFIPNEQVGLYFCSADIVAQPYKSATQSGVTQIAYHFEVPMLVTRVGGLPEMVPHAKVGYVTEPDPGDISKYIATFFRENAAEKMISQIRQEKKRFSWELMVNSIMEFV